MYKAVLELFLKSGVSIGSSHKDKIKGKKALISECIKHKERKNLRNDCLCVIGVYTQL